MQDSGESHPAGTHEWASCKAISSRGGTGHLTTLQLCAHTTAALLIPYSTSTRSLSNTGSAGLKTSFKAGHLGLPHIPSWLPSCQAELLGATSVCHPETPSFTDVQVTGVTRWNFKKIPLTFPQVLTQKVIQMHTMNDYFHVVFPCCEFAQDLQKEFCMLSE